MSAWDIAGAVVWTGLMILFLVFALPNPNTNAAGKVLCLIIGVPSAALAIFCIARLFGAHA